MTVASTAASDAGVATSGASDGGASAALSTPVVARVWGGGVFGRSPPGGSGEGPPAPPPAAASTAETTSAPDASLGGSIGAFDEVLQEVTLGSKRVTYMAVARAPRATRSPSP